VFLVTIPIVVLRPLELLHEAEALQVEFADFWVTELPPHPVGCLGSASQNVTNRIHPSTHGCFLITSSKGLETQEDGRHVGQWYAL